MKSSDTFKQTKKFFGKFETETPKCFCMDKKILELEQKTYMFVTSFNEELKSHIKGKSIVSRRK